MEIFIFMVFAVALFYSGYYTGKRDAHDPVPFFPALPEIVTQTVDKVRQAKPEPIDPDEARSNAFYS
jgi:hypothetical protein